MIPLPGAKAGQGGEDMRELLENEMLKTVLRAVGILAATLVAVWVLRRVEHRTAKLHPNGNAMGRRLFFRIATAVIYCLGILSAVSQFKTLSSLVTTLLAGSGILAVAIGLAAQDGFSNIVGGLFLTIFHPFDVGDKVVLPAHNITGVVEDISLRHTVIKTIIGTRFIVPNSVMNSSVIENVNFETEAGVSNWIDVSIAYDADVTKAKQIMARIIREHPLYYVRPGKEDSPVQVLVRTLSDSGMELRAAMCTENLDNSFIACSDARQQIVTAFAKSGIEIPYNKLDVYMKS